MHTKQFNLPSFSTADEHHSMMRQCSFKHGGNSCITGTQHLNVNGTPNRIEFSESDSYNNPKNNQWNGIESSSTQTRKEHLERNRWMDDENSTHSDEIDSEKERHRIYHKYRTGRDCQCHCAKIHDPPNKKGWKQGMGKGTTSRATMTTTEDERREATGVGGETDSRQKWQKNTRSRSNKRPRKDIKERTEDKKNDQTSQEKSGDEQRDTEIRSTQTNSELRDTPRAN